MRLEPTLLTALILAALPAVAAAQECPPGGWFCEEDETSTGTDTGADTDADATTEESDNPDVVVVEADKVELPDEEETDSGPTVVVVKKKDDDDKIVVIGKDTEAPPPPEPVHRFYQEWGFNLRLEGALIDDDNGADNSGMGGLGFSFRYRPAPAFAFDFGLDFVGGRDWHGDRRQERGMPFSGIIFFNPYDAVQAYALGGFHFAWANVDVEQQDTIGGSTIESVGTRHYSYFGGHLGGGVEFRVGKKSALNVDMVGFIRGRTDDAAEAEPEFVDPNNPNVTTNTSGGGLLRGGVTFYW